MHSVDRASRVRTRTKYQGLRGHTLQDYTTLHYPGRLQFYGRNQYMPFDYILTKLTKPEAVRSWEMSSPLFAPIASSMS